jgi:hypothetical protein
MSLDLNAPISVSRLSAGSSEGPVVTHGQQLAEQCVGLNTFAGRALAPRGLITPEGPTSKLSGWIKRDYVGET